MHDAKYIVFKRDEFYELMGELALPRGDVDCAPVAAHIIERAEATAVPDATVIRGQDILAPLALHAYADGAKAEHLWQVAEVFHRRAVEAEQAEFRKLPD
jgi:hypothetical protein